jgi:hypothetical protein
MLSLTAFAGELEREKARQRTYDAMQRKAAAGHVTGGRVFGYDNVKAGTGSGPIAIASAGARGGADQYGFAAGRPKRRSRPSPSWRPQAGNRAAWTDGQTPKMRWMLSLAPVK